MKKRCICLYYD